MTNKPEDNFSKPFVIAIKTIFILFAVSMIAIMITHENFLDADKQVWKDYTGYIFMELTTLLIFPVCAVMLLIKLYELDESKKYKGILRSEFFIATALSAFLTSMAIGFEYSSNPKNKITMEQFLKGEPTFINRETINKEAK